MMGSELHVATAPQGMFLDQELAIGDVAPDGAVFAGLSARGTHRIFTLPANISCARAFNEAAAAVQKLNGKRALGHDDWQIPTLETLKILFTNKDAGALKNTFPASADEAAWYWSSSEHTDLSVNVWVQRFTDGRVYWSHKDSHKLSCRPVRLEALA